MTKALIVTSHVEHLNNVILDSNIYDCIICADGGLLIAEQLDLKTDLLIGDYDSMVQPKNRDLIKLPTEKDMTDTEAALDLAVSKGFTSIDILGGLGGRFDHTMGNIGLLSKYVNTLDKLALIDGQNYVFMITPGETIVEKRNYKYLGLISYDGPVVGLTLKGTKYLLDNHTLTADTTLGVSNEIIDKTARINFKKGKLLVILSKDVEK